MTIAEIASRAGVSKAAVSRYLNNGYVSSEKREAIRRVIEETGYVPSQQAQTLRTGKSRMVGVIVPRIDSESISRVVAGISRVLEEQGYRLLLANTDNRVEKELEYLDMKNARLEVEFLPQGDGKQIKFTKKGIDNVRFLLAANAGEGFKALSKVASGGELSRIMLAIRNVISKGDLVETMIFDEVDTGVSGRAANKVGEKLWSISREKQVLCVTHLPQIAALADRHYKVSKSVEGNATHTRVELLDSKGKIAEIARLTGGRDITDTTLLSAGEIIDLAEKYKKQNLIGGK